MMKTLIIRIVDFIEFVSLSFLFRSFQKVKILSKDSTGNS